MKTSNFTSDLKSTIINKLNDYSSGKMYNIRKKNFGNKN
jgi:hypothetical protein